MQKYLNGTSFLIYYTVGNIGSLFVFATGKAPPGSNSEYLTDFPGWVNLGYFLG